MVLAIGNRNKSGKETNSFSPRPYVIAGYTTIALAFGVFGTWAATAPLAAGVVSSGVVSVESNRKSIQHLEGGIVDEIFVEEGDVVEAGAPLVRLDSTQAQGNYTVLSTRQTILQATEARLVAESVNADQIEFPQDLLLSEDGQEQAAVTLQRTLFADRKATKDGQVDILRVRIEQLNEEIAGLETQLQATEQQRESITDEVDRLTTGQQSGIVATNQLSQLTRQQMELQGQVGSITAQIAKIKQNVAETELQIVQINQEFKERAGSELRDIRDQLNEVSERVVQARDVLDRTMIISPVRGMVQGIRIHTNQGVIQSAEPIMDIIPLEDDLIVNARVRPLDIDSVDTGARAEVRFAAFQSRTTPVIFGQVEVLSQDVIQPEDSRAEPYYMARVRVDDADVPDEIRGRLMPGMPADIIIATGERTLVQYLVRPLEDAFAKGMREQ
ncbi:HlyD family type I secretion periplasmic adaptor subunit [Devosia pacifica]|uniref:Membrane fusion protein (MFP) family protein n=1 Tax=Devosia pacifica TaxID=1335967 RepID=A0A918SC03_9HYPH|nr:HlyD family type I secretion periplasmic adaptor subunit [Devosia pacifica]GHA32545.1 HlyD family type I secretion periplasmic adaptor subunit [Devosia pacifica]